MNFSTILSKNMTPYLTILFSLIIIIVPIEIYGEFPISIVDQKIFKSLNGDWNLIGVVQNNAGAPLEVKVGVNITKPNNTFSILTNNTFSNVIHPYVAAPFKFTISSNEFFNGLAYPIETKKVAKPFFIDLTQKYSNLATDNEKALAGTIKNTGSNIIKNDVYFYSCAGLDINAPISTLNIGNGEYLVFNLESVSAISSFRYENSSDSIIFEIKPYNPLGGPTIFQVPQVSSNQKIDIFLDGKQYENKIITMDGKTISMNIFIPKDKHEVKISGIRNHL